MSHKAKKKIVPKGAAPKRPTTPPQPSNEGDTGLVEEVPTDPAPTGPPPPPVSPLTDSPIIGLDDQPRPQPAAAPAPAEGEPAPAPAAPPPAVEAPSMRLANGVDYEAAMADSIINGSSLDLDEEGADGGDPANPDASFAPASLPDDVSAQGGNAAADFLLNLVDLGSNLVIVPLRAYDEPAIAQQLVDAGVEPKAREKILTFIAKENRKNAAPAAKPFKPQYRQMIRGPLARWWAASGLQEIPPVVQLSVMAVIVGALMYRDTRTQMQERDRIVKRLLDNLTTKPAEVVRGAAPAQDLTPTEEV